MVRQPAACRATLSVCGTGRSSVAQSVDRLDGRDALGSDVADSIRRDSFSDTVSAALRERFDNAYGKYIVSIFERFLPYEAHNQAAVNLEEKVEGFQDRQLRPILFEGQGIGRVFETHREALHKKLAKSANEGGFSTDVPQIEAIAKRLDGTAQRVESAINEFRTERAELCLKELTEKGQLRDDNKKYSTGIVRWFNDLYQNVTTTVAFQAAIVCGFFTEIEKASAKANIQEGEPIDVKAAFDDFVSQLNAFFVPTSIAHLKRVIRVFSGEPAGERPAEWRIAPSTQTFGAVVHRGEMQPDQWPKYKYLLIELWKPDSQFGLLAETVEFERDACRKQVFSSLYHHNKNAYCRENAKFEEDLEKDELKQVFDQSLNAYNGMLKNLKADAVTLERARNSIIISSFDDNASDSYSELTEE